MPTNEPIELEVNPHFEDFLFDWDQKYQLLVGGYGSSKSHHAATKIILKLLAEKRKALVVREVYETIRESCFDLLADIAREMRLYTEKKSEKKIQFTTSPLQVRFPNGSRIIFKGMDDEQKLKSINGVTLVWIEECSEIKYKGFKEIARRLRHPKIPLHMILTTNPIETINWVYTHFFIDHKNKRTILDERELYKKRIMVVGRTYYHHSTADDNYFLSSEYIEELDELKEYDPDLYRVARLGRFGASGKKVLPQFSKAPHIDVMEAIAKIKKPLSRTGMDFGFEESYNAVIKMVVDTERHYLYIYKEYYKNNMTDDETALELTEYKESGELIITDSAEPKAISYYQKQGFNMKGAKKFPGSRLQNIKKTKRFKKIICSDECENVIHELENLVYKKDRSGNDINDQFNIDPHTFSAIWYGLDGYEVANLKEKSKKESKKRSQGRRRA